MLTITKILDGTPSHVKHSRQKGQSLLEMALVTPLLFIMVIGIVEIGWFANNYLTLLEVTRIGARTGTVLVDALSPLAWDDAASLHREVLLHMGVVEYEGIPNGDPVPDPAPARDNRYDLGEWARDCDDNRYTGFYKFIACSMEDSLEPLTIKRDQYQVTERDGTVVNEDYVDDIIISTFSLQAVNNDNPATWAGDPVIYSRTFNFELDPDSAGDFPAGPSVIVVGRYPTNANECNMWDAGGIPIMHNDRDPFDFYNYGTQDRTRAIDGVVRDIELEPADNGPEYQRGFVWTGQYQPQEEADDGSTLICWGSNFTIEEVEDLMNTNNFIPDGSADYEERRQYLPSQGMVLVEMVWNHSLLINFPFFDTFVRMFGDTQRVSISVWAAFPAPTVEPNIVFDLN
ncbi:MAG: pilus assembly protein [Anaerolineae bacterium]|nr:pilus assembly protein [Anaerolineae bacterium]